MRTIARIVFGLLLAAVIGGAGMNALGADHVLLIGGPGGDEKYTKDFSETLLSMRTVLIERHGYEAKNIHLLAENKAISPDVNDTATSATIRREMGRLAKAMKTSDTLLLVMVGHGQSDFVEPKFNLPGPDLTGHALAEMLGALPPSDQRLILAFECAGHFAQILSKPGRCILASGDGARQIYQTIILPKLVLALSSSIADADRDGRLSMQELYLFVAREVDNYYKAHNYLQTENTALEDNGDGDVSTLAKGMNAGDGDRAKAAWITPAPGSEAARKLGEAKLADIKVVGKKPTVKTARPKVELEDSKGIAR